MDTSSNCSIKEESLEDSLNNFMSRWTVDGKTRTNVTVDILRSQIPKFLKHYNETVGVLPNEGCSKKKTNWSSKPPSNWPSDIPFEDPNNPKKNDKKFYKKDVLLRMMNGFVENYTKQSVSTGDAMDSPMSFHDGERLGAVYPEEILEDDECMLVDSPDDIDNTLLWNIEQRIKRKLAILEALGSSLIIDDFKKRLGIINQQNEFLHEKRNLLNQLERDIDCAKKNLDHQSTNAF